MTFVEFLDSFKIWGPLGIFSALTTWGCVHLYRHGRADAKASAAAALTAAEKHATVIASQAAAHAAELKEKDAQQHEQMTEVSDRFMGLYEKVATENRELTTQVRELLAVVSAKAKRGR